MIEEEEILNQIVNELPSLHEALAACVRKNGLSDKQVYLELGIDGGQWSRIMSGNANFPLTKLPELLRICRNDIFLRWIVKKCGYRLEASMEVLEEKVKEQESVIKYLETRLKDL